MSFRIDEEPDTTSFPCRVHVDLRGRSIGVFRFEKLKNLGATLPNDRFGYKNKVSRLHQ